MIMLELINLRHRGGSRRISEDWGGGGGRGSFYHTSITRTYSKYSGRQVCANCLDPNQTPQNAASDQGLHCLPLT